MLARGWSRSPPRGELPPVRPQACARPSVATQTLGVGNGDGMHSPMARPAGWRCGAHRRIAPGCACKAARATPGGWRIDGAAWQHRRRTRAEWRLAPGARRHKLSRSSSPRPALRRATALTQAARARAGGRRRRPGAGEAGRPRFTKASRWSVWKPMKMEMVAQRSRRRPRCAPCMPANATPWPPARCMVEVVIDACTDRRHLAPARCTGVLRHRTGAAVRCACTSAGRAARYIAGGARSPLPPMPARRRPRRRVRGHGTARTVPAARALEPHFHLHVLATQTSGWPS